MTQPKHDPDRVLNLRVTPELKARLAALLEHVPTGAAKLSRHGLAVWCLERGLMEAEAAPASVLASPARPETPSSAPTPAAPRARPERSPAPSPPAGEGPEAGDVRARLAAARERGVSLAEIARRSGVQSSGLSRFLGGEVATLKGDGLARVGAALGELGVP